MDPLDNKRGFFVVFDDVEGIANIWEVLEASNVDCLTRVGFFDSLTSVIEHESDFAFMDARHEDVFLTERATFDDHRCCDLI